MGETYLTLREAAKMSGYHPDYIGSLARKGRVQGKKIGHSWVVDRGSFEDFLGIRSKTHFFAKPTFLKTTLSFVFLFAVIGFVTVAFLSSSMLKDDLTGNKQANVNVIKTLDTSAPATVSMR